MKVGDLVKVVRIDGHPIGMILEVRDHPSGYRIQHYLVQLFGRQPDWPTPRLWLRHQLEIVK